MLSAFLPVCARLMAKKMEPQNTQNTLMGSVPHRPGSPKLISRHSRKPVALIVQALRTMNLVERSDRLQLHQDGVLDQQVHGIFAPPQCSPLVANLYVNRFLKHWRQTGKGRGLAGACHQLRGRLRHRQPRSRGRGTGVDGPRDDTPGA
jgi:hypothetical protein